MVKVIKKKQETNISLLKRFSRQMKQSGRLLKFKKSRVKTRRKSKVKKKAAVLKKIGRLEKMKKLYKMGKIDKKPQE
ncbi:MAG: hypothetical protein COT67_02765 [Candidatus Tagabacteria bacterium CG09_land_8_20_14_0_10_41_14]|uniref:30S ribosomal protein S21 n=2 Tax=Candidatus Tagaibacteriota TaxID=1817918 RepID=A0A2H0WKT9_9BACT|nr:MAG: hypothetical protein COT67_02765 [Candidatus Tagabacteria bacterium CG09_land_8_20_14_0_10_41_14]PJE73261.1 MAG: hypothetical protein COV00_00785 [Candidatus Tagabacteria bacterium CG10_big_fil_rev_8_21_14_0_10_40_13]